jgi:hypothetical protein
MSDRREAAVRQLERFTRIQGSDARRVVDMVIAAYERSEPTEAEIEAVARVAMGCPYTPPCPYCMDRSRDGLLAARKAAS